MATIDLSPQQYPPLQVVRRYFRDWTHVFHFSELPSDLPYFVPATHATVYGGSLDFDVPFRFFLYSKEHGLVYGIVKPFYTEYNLDALWDKYSSLLEELYGAGDLRILRRVYRVLTEDFVSDYEDGEYYDTYLSSSEQEFTQYTLYLSDFSDALPGILRYGDRYYLYYYSPYWERFDEYVLKYDLIFSKWYGAKQPEDVFIAVPEHIMPRIYSEMVKRGWIYGPGRR